MPQTERNMSSLDKVQLLSSPSEYMMANEWFEFACSDHFWFQWRFDALKKILPETYKWGRTLDVGCGNAITARQVQECWNFSIEGCDLNMQALQAALPCDGRLYFYDINDRREEFHQRFSTILLLDVLEHIKSPVEFLKSVRFHLKDAGALIVNVPALPSLYSRYDKVATHIKRYTQCMLEDELHKAGFIKKRSMYWAMSMMPLVLLRKLTLFAIPKEKIIQMGFQPPNKFANKFLQGLRHIECRLFPQVPVGTSLMALAVKKKE